MISETDERLLARWKGRGFVLYCLPLQDNDRDCIFSDGSEVLRVPARPDGTPSLVDADRDILEARVMRDEQEKDGYLPVDRMPSRAQVPPVAVPVSNRKRIGRRGAVPDG